MNEVLTTGMGWTKKHGYSWPEDSDSCEEFGCYPKADPSQVSPSLLLLKVYPSVESGSVPSLCVVLCYVVSMTHASFECLMGNMALMLGI